MAEESVKQKVLRVARKVLTADPHRRVEPGNAYYFPNSHATRSFNSLPSRFPLPKPHKQKHIPTRPTTQPVGTDNLGVYPFRFPDLPLEVLQHIFLCCTEPRSDGSPYHKVCPEWLPITQVCRLWRAVTHHHPLLWSLITPNLNVFWADVFQQRSQPLLLDVHLRVGRRDIDDREACMSTYPAMVILRFISHRVHTLRLDGPREDIQSLLSTLRTPSPIHALSINIPLWDLGAPFSIPENLFAFNASIRTLSFSADRALQAPRWLLRGLTNFTTGGRVSLPDLLDALRQMPILEHFTLLHCSPTWNESDVPPAAPIPMDKLEEFAVRAESPRHFVLLAMQLAIPETARKRLAVRTLAAPGWGFWARWLEALPPLYSARGGLQHILISGGPTRGCFRAWTDGPYDDMARFCFEMEWHGSPPAPDGVRAIELTSPFYRLHTLCDELKAARVSRVVVEGDPGRVVVPDDYWYQLLARLPAVEELWLYPGTAEVLRSTCPPGPPGDSAGSILQSLKRLYVVEGRVTVPKLENLRTPSAPYTAWPSDEEGRGPSLDRLDFLTLLHPAVEVRDEAKKKAEALCLDVTPGLMALLQNGATGLREHREIHLRNCEVEDGALSPLCALAKVRNDNNWVLTDLT
ncbi:hypothetical protein EDB89DRAFT_1951406 [Lactarius sanguifluus]|nr:hypothetical protein EDB89DRAFT_1951406 [Lactarius sanguifluus]